LELVERTTKERGNYLPGRNMNRKNKEQTGERDKDSEGREQKG
jgi:hypothetical protein